ncbi:HD-GYP domain-containing protein [Filobacillus milosensis]|uniref:HD-GYP domain-containing protein n=1 Tax=Filobacillus milosensis TaxID=94137 RepID=A0A4Y8IG88_9BACI|nr:HD-GYP domain-containing protein [Filobacillus milosensis]TFB19637.1 HD-GYP domain-containing protein [Filobacillus milosensis]
MELYNRFTKTLLINYFIGSVIAVGGIGGVFIFNTLTLTQTDIVVLLIILILSIIVMFIAEYRQFTKDVHPIKQVYSSEAPSLSTIEAGFVAANKLPWLTVKRVMGPHWLGLSFPAIGLALLSINIGLLSLPYRYVLFAFIGSLLVAGMHALIEFYLTMNAVHIVTKHMVKLAKSHYNHSLSLNGDVLISLKQKFQFSTIFIGIFPLLLFSLASQIRLEEVSESIIFNYWEWAVVILIINVVFASFASYLLFKGIDQPMQQLQHDMKSVQDGEFVKTDELYSDEFSRLTYGFNHMVESIKERDEMNQNLSESLITTLAAALDAKDPYTAGHSYRVSEYSVEIGKRANLSKDQLTNLRKSALLHDIGKIGINDSILLKDGKLSDEEFDEIKKHPIYGYDILTQVKPIEKVIPYLEGVRHHHERYDGGGYPDGLKGEQIPLFGRIMAVADAFDAMTSDRPYRKGFTQEKALSILKEGKGTQWDAEFVDLFLEYMYEDEPTLRKLPLK